MFAVRHGVGCVLAVRAVEVGDDGCDWMLVALGANVVSCELMAMLAGQYIVTGG